ncbi:hypothetical protein [Symbioplanes lichenis]|uniref:hypothetical protein n=1 Tax=Symbioplanes lichenis TaxID=1629072 RepID=UPI002739F39F|nr:hypothetical protein [Actinoplanes lichenis]
MVRVLRLPVLAGALVASGLLAACGAPPEPPATAPPLATGPDPSASVSLPPPVLTPILPTQTTPALPGGLPTTPAWPTLPTTTTTPVYTPPVTPTTTIPTPATPTQSPAPRCTAGPTAAQVIAVVKGTAGIPDRPLKVVDGPSCSGSWQFSVMEIEAANAGDKYEPLSVVTKGQPAALQLVEAGTDVCSLVVQSEAPAGIRVRACGA